MKEVCTGSKNIQGFTTYRDQGRLTDFRHMDLLMVQNAFEYIKFNNEGAQRTDFILSIFMQDPSRGVSILFDF